MIAVAMRTQHNVEPINFLLVGWCRGIAGYPGINDDLLPTGSVNQKSSVAQPGDLNSVQIHARAFL